MGIESIALRRAEDGGWTGLEGAVRRATTHLAAGGLLGHPTLGVYGIGGERSPACERRLESLKRGEGRTGFVYLVPDIETARVVCPEVRWPMLAERLAEEFWPGPLTLVLADGSPDGIALRAEGHPVTRAVLRSWGRAMSSTSLNRAGAEPARTSREAAVVLEAMSAEGESFLWLDAGDLGRQPPSTLVRVNEGRYEVVRAGAVPVDEIDACLA